MEKIVVLSGDVKLQKEIGQWLKELNEKVTVEIISDLATFHQRYCQPPKTNVPVEGADPAQSEGAVQGETPEQPLFIRLIILDLESLKEDVVTWIKKASIAMFEFGYTSAQVPARFMLLGYPDDKFNVDSFRNTVIDDLMLKPLDKPVFLQKVELYTAEKGTLRTSFLYKQKTDQIIEMGKDTWIESVSEFGFAIRNPAPLSAGVFAKVYCAAIFGEGPRASVIGRVYSAERHPSEQGAYLCYLTFHGITAEQMINVRKLIRQDKSAAAKRDRQPSNFEAPIKTIVTIDLNGDTREVIRDSIESNFANVQVFGFPSYNAFLKYCNDKAPSNGMLRPRDFAEPTEVAPAAQDTLGGDKKIYFVVDSANGELISIDPSPRDSILILGEEAGDLRARPNAWMRIFDDANREAIEEFLAYLRSGQAGDVLVQCEARHLGRVNLRITGRLDRTTATDGIVPASLKFEELTNEEWQIATATPANHEEVGSIDAIYIDGSFLGAAPDTSLEGLFVLLRRAQLVQSRDSFTLTVMGDEKSKLKPEDFRLKSVHDFIYKPVDRKMLIAKAAVQIRGLLQKTDSVDLHYRRASKQARVTKEVLMDELSEFGLQITHPTPLREDTFLRFFSPIFLDTTGNGILGRCLYSSRDETDGRYRCFFNFFGASDSQLKHIRTWIRGDYAARKEKSSG